MAFCTQRKFPGQCYEHNGLAEINKMKGYSSVKDHRAWSIDQNQQTNYLVEAVHKGEGDTVNSQHIYSNGRNDCRNDVKKLSKRVGTVAIDGLTSLETSRSDSLKVFELSMELEETKLKNRKLKNENDDLKKQIANIMTSEHEHEREENIQNHLQILEDIISERNDLRELLDKFLGITDQIIELKIQADQTRNVESDYILLQTKFKEYQIELDTLRNEKKNWEDRVLELETTSQETSSLKETNSKLENDLHELSNVISVSDNFIRDQASDIEMKLETIEELKQQIEHLKVALSEAEMKLNKKLRLEMDVELMEKELSIMIENSAESNSYNQQVEDLATAIKLTLGCMNYEFENNEEDNLVEANRQLKTLLLESSNKILEFKDVINKQEHNLMKVSNDFACKNDELTECLATVEELKRQLANTETTKNYKKTDTYDVQTIAITCTDNVPIDEKDHEIFENEINLADSPTNSDDDDGPEIEVLENIFEKSLSQHGQEMKRAKTLSDAQIQADKKKNDFMRLEIPLLSKASESSFKANGESSSADILRRLNSKIEHMSNYINDLESKNKELQSQKMKEKYFTGSENENEKRNDSDNERDICETLDILPGLDVNNEFLNLQHKLNDMTSEIDNLQKANDELRETVRKLQHPILLKQSSSKSMSQLLNEAQKISTNRRSESIKETENQNEKLKLENDKLVAEISKLKNSEHESQINVAELEKELQKMSSTVETLVTELNDKKFGNCELAGNYMQGVDGSPPEELTLKYGGALRTADIKDVKKSSTAAERELGNDNIERIVAGFPDHAGKTESENLLAEIRKLQSENLALKKEVTDSRSAQQTNKSESNEPLASNHRKKLSTKSQQFESNLTSTDTEKTENVNLKLENEKLVVEIGNLKNSENQAQIKVSEMQKQVERMTSTIENLAAELDDRKFHRGELSGNYIQDGISPGLKESTLKHATKEIKDVNKSLNAAESELGNDRENETREKVVAGFPDHVVTTESDRLLAEIKKLQSENLKLKKEVTDAYNTTKQTNKSKSKNESLSSTYQRKLSTKSQQFESDLISGDVEKIENENLNLKFENEKLVIEIAKLKDSENCSHSNVLEMEKELQKLTSINEQLAEELGGKKLEKDLILAKTLESIPTDLRDLVLKNEKLKEDNESLLLKLRRFEQADTTLSSDVLKTTDCSEQNKEIKTSDYENKSEPEWLPTNEDLVAEIEKLQQSKNKSNLSIRQMEKDMKKLESINENLLAQLNDKKAELKHSSKPVEYILHQNEELKTVNGNLAVEISELKNSESLARSNEAEMKVEWENLAAVNKALIAEINKLKQGTNTSALQNLNAVNDNLLSEKGELISPGSSSHMSILQIGKDLERLAALNESLLALNDTDIEKKNSLQEGMVPDVHQLLKKNQELKNANESLLAKIRELQNTENQAHLDSIESKNRLETLAEDNKSLQAEIKELERFSSTERSAAPDMHTLKNENAKLKSTNDKLMGEISFLEEKLRSIENRTGAYLKTSSSTNKQQLTIGTTESVQAVNDYSMEIDWMVSDMKKLQSKNESLRATNEKLLSQISDLQSCATPSNLTDETINVSEKMLDNKESDAQLIYASNRNIEIEWMKSDMDALQKKNEKLKITNESLAAEIAALKSAETRSYKNVQQVERDLLRLSAINERLSSQLNEKRLDKKQLSKARVEERNAATTDSKDLLKKIEELTNSNESLVSEITELKSLDIVKMRNDLKKLSSTNESLKLQMSELKLLSCNDLKMESDWMASDMKRLLNKNKKLNVSNQNLLSEINDLRREFRSLENRANLNALQKIKELDRLSALNETLKDQVNYQKNDKKNARSHEIGLDTLAPDVKKVQKKNEELKAANEKLLSVIINLKNSEKLASYKAAELEKELQKLQETNKNLQDTLENYVEKDWSKPTNQPKTELERICQLILNEGICSLTDTEFSYMYKWFCKSAATEFEIPKTSRKNTTRKHCRICDNCDKICDCKQYEEKKRLNLLKEIEETKLAIEHIQSSNDIEFDMNDVKNRLLKGKPADQSLNTGRKYEIKLSQSQGSVNVRAHIITMPARCDN